MSEQTTNLSLPYIMAAQAQKHVTHNEALRALDALVQISVEDQHLSEPPSAPVEGARYIVGPSATGDWGGQDGNIAAFQDGAWEIYVPVAGWVAWSAGDSSLLIFDGSDWNAVLGGGSSVGLLELSDGTVTKIGINTTADDTNRLSVNSPAIMFNHLGDDVRAKLNKNITDDTASVLFQTGFSGRAEIGTTGDDDFHFKVSPDGSSYHEAILIDKDDGSVEFPNSDIGKTKVTIIKSGTATYTTPVNCRALKVTCVGGGGGGAGGETTATSNFIGCPGGSAGGACVKYISSPAASYSYSVGSAGGAGSAPSPHATGDASGEDGTATTFSGGGVSLLAGGGGGGTHRLETSGIVEYSAGSMGVASGGDLNINGGRGGGITVFEGKYQMGAGSGGDSIYGFGGLYRNGTGLTGTGYGSGGAGAGMLPGYILNRPGGSGRGGIIIVEEYY